MTAKWGTRYATLVAQANAMLRNANEAIENRDWRAAELAVREGLAVDPGNGLIISIVRHPILNGHENNQT